MNFFQYCKEIKRIKEKEFKLKSENFEEENLKARDRYYQALYEKKKRQRRIILLILTWKLKFRKRKKKILKKT